MHRRSRSDSGRPMQADLIHINRATQHNGPRLAKSWKVFSSTETDCSTHWRFARELPVFFFPTAKPRRCGRYPILSGCLDLKGFHAKAARNLLIVRGQPIAVRKLDAQTVVVPIGQKPMVPAKGPFSRPPCHLLPRPFCSRNPITNGNLAQLPGRLPTPLRISGRDSDLFRLKE